MANDFKIVISATDKATATIRKINESMSGLTRPIDSIQKIGKEIGKNPIAKGLKAIGSAAGGVASSLAKVAGPMLGITGIGVIAGLAEATTQWARLGLEIKNTAGSLGATTSGLQSMRGAAKLAGLSGEAMTGGLESVRQSMQDAKWGRNPAVLMLMNKLGMSFRMTANGSVDAIESLKDVADAVAATKDVGAKHTIAQAFGADGLFPLLNKGRKGIEDAQKSMQQLGGIMSPEQTDRADKFSESLNRLAIAASGVKNSLGDKLIPVVQPLIDQLADGLKKKKEGGTKSAADLVGIALHPVDSWFAGIKKMGHAALPDWIYPSAVTQQEVSGKIKSLAGSVSAPLGIRSNNPLNMMPGGKEAVYPSMEAGIGAAIQNLRGKKYFGGGNDTAAGIINTWSPPNAPGNSAAKNANYIAGVTRAVGPGHLDGNDPQVMAKLISAMAEQENGAGTFDKTKMENSVQHMVIEFKGAPQGTSATARTASGTNVPVRIASAMPAMGAP